MEAVNRESYGAAVDQLATLRGGPMLRTVADEVLSVAALLAEQSRLRRTLADPARPGVDRAELIASILRGKVSDQTVELLATLVRGRWSSSPELLNGVEQLGVEALLAGAEADGDLAEVEDELFRFGQVVDGNMGLASTLGSSTAPVPARLELAKSLLRDKVRPATLRLVDVAVHGFGGRNFSNSLTRLVELAAQRREQQLAYVTVAAPLTPREEGRLAGRLSAIYGRAVELKVSVVPGVLGGVKVVVGDDMYDGTVLRRIQASRAALVEKR